MYRRLLIFFAVYGALSLYWVHTYDLRFYGTDELNVFVSIEKANDAEGFIRIFLEPHNRHFIPVFKAVLYVEYLLFGTSPAPYHAVSIALFSLSTLLFWRFLREEVSDNTAAVFSTALYATYSTNVIVVGWIFIQSFILTLVFIELAFLNLQGNRPGVRKSLAAGLFCLLASLCTAFGALAWLFMTVYYGARYYRKTEKPTFGALIVRLLPVWASAAFTFALYALVWKNISGSPGASLVTDPSVIAKGIMAVIGSNLLMGLGISYLANSVLPGLFSESAVNLLKAIAFIVAMSALVLSLRTLSGARRTTVLTFLSFACITAAVIVSASVEYLEVDVFSIASILRYNYFLFFFLLAGVAPFFAHFRAGIRKWMPAVLPVWLILHYFIYIDVIKVRSEAADLISSALATAERSATLNLPAVPALRDGNIVLLNRPMTRPIPLKDFRFFEFGEFSYRIFLELYSDSDDIIVDHPQGFLFLRRQLPVPFEAISPDRATSLQAKGERLEVSGASKVRLAISGVAIPVPSRYQHLSFRLKAEQPSTGTVLCGSGQGNPEEAVFAVRSSWTHRFYILPCPSAETVSLSLGPGRYSLKDVSFRY